MLKNTFVIIVTFNGVKWIKECIASVIKQCRVIVVDNNSSDETISYIRLNFPEVILLPQIKNLGFGKANNIGISYALKMGADAVFLLNQDAYIKNDCIKNLEKASNENPEFGIISPIHLNVDGSAVDHSFLNYTTPYYIPNLISDLVVNNFSKSIYETKFINAAAWYIPVKVFLIVGGFDPIFFMYGEDDNFCQRLVYHGFKIGIIPNATIFHDSNNFSHSLQNIGYDDERYYNLFLKNVYVKYADVNNYKKIKLIKFKFYLLRKAIIKFLKFNIADTKFFIEKFKRIDIKRISSSVHTNRIIGSNYLNLNQ